MPEAFSNDRSWGPTDNPATALREFLRLSDRFVVDELIDSKLALTAAPGGYLKCVR
jgi:cephalosporin hydroxylase